tara:strand:+ start:249 stop:458 length:210 start_codon:yes stop_codon:yes gene_type:complete
MQIEQWVKTIESTKLNKKEKYVWIYKPVKHTDLDNHIVIRLVQWRNGSKYSCMRGGWKIYAKESIDKTQ